jgi:beta-1,4-glucosyltransferase
MPKCLILGPIRLEHLTLREALERVEFELENGGSRLIAFCNAHSVAQAFRNSAYCKALSKMLVLNDGVAVDIASSLITGRSFPANLNGTDFVPAFLGSAKKPLRIYLLGAKPDVVKLAADRLATLFPKHRVVGFRDGYFSQAEEIAVVAEIAKAAPDLLLVAMGNPRQELFMNAHANSLNCSLTIGVGALFDFMSNAVPRAPGWIRRARLEWAFRLWNEPRRLAYRYTVEAFTFALAVFMLRMQYPRNAS